MRAIDLVKQLNDLIEIHGEDIIVSLYDSEIKRDYQILDVYYQNEDKTTK